MFVDTVKISLTAGNGGNGVVAWRREKFIPKGGPAGGDGGHGGSISLRTNPQVYSLQAYRNHRILKAESGHAGGGNNRQGRNGKNLVLEIPCGTIVKDAATGEVLYDCTEEGTEIIICKGGRGGRGNSHFKSPTHQAPNIYTPGTDGEMKEVELELKLIADVGLVGMPNAGKSTFMSAITHVQVKIAPYPFTTLHPNLSYVKLEDFSRILVADIPGIIQGAHQNKGLGLSFLRHIERTSVLVYVIDLSGIEGRDPLEDFNVLRKELQEYNPEMLEKPFLVALNKIDTEEGQENLEKFKDNFPFDTSLLFAISAKEKMSLAPLLDRLQTIAQQDGKRF